MPICIEPGCVVRVELERMRCGPHFDAWQKAITRPSLGPCPFCGGTEINEAVLDGGGDLVWCQLECDTCHARGPFYPDDPEAAILGWNTRAYHPK